MNRRLELRHSGFHARVKASRGSVELWNDSDQHVEELIALTGDYRAAPAGLTKRLSTGQIGSSPLDKRLGQKARLMADSRRKGS